MDRRQHLEGEAGEQPGAGRERARIVDLAGHRRGGDGRDLVAPADAVGQLVEGLDPDHGRIHVGDQQPLAAPGAGLSVQVDRQAGGGGARRRQRRAGRGALEGEIDRAPRRQPVRRRRPRPAPRQGGRDPPREHPVEGLRLRVANQRQHMFHGRGDVRGRSRGAGAASGIVTAPWNRRRSR